MEIEEEEYFFSRGAPLRAWRLFRVRVRDDGFALYSPMIDGLDATPWLGSKSAICYESHCAPAAGCRCGIYAAVPGTLDSLPGYLFDNPHDRDPYAYTEVACTGRVFVDMRGVRAERAEILSIALAETCWPDSKTLEIAKVLLRELYEVPVLDVAAVPAWVTTNVRDGGPPPDEVELDLDLSQLDLRS